MTSFERQEPADGERLPPMMRTGFPLDKYGNQQPLAELVIDNGLYERDSLAQVVSTLKDTFQWDILHVSCRQASTSVVCAVPDLDGFLNTILCVAGLDRWRILCPRKGEKRFLR